MTFFLALLSNNNNNNNKPANSLQHHIKTQAISRALHIRRKWTKTRNINLKLSSKGTAIERRRSVLNISSEVARRVVDGRPFHAIGHARKPRSPYR